MRVVEVWLDEEYKEYFYAREPTVRGYPIGDISKQLEFKRTHNCKSFKWFMENVAYEVQDKFPPPPPNLAWGEVSLTQLHIKSSITHHICKPNQFYGLEFPIYIYCYI